jgi:hypothetical protein
MKTIVDELIQLELELIKTYENTLSKAGKLGVEEARHTKLFKHGNSFDEKIQFTPHGANQGTVESGAEYSGYLEYGNNQNGDMIYPVAANVLHFFANGQEVFTRHVRAHGPLPFMANAADKVEEELPHLWAAEFDKLIK